MFLVGKERVDPLKSSFLQIDIGFDGVEQFLMSCGFSNSFPISQNLLGNQKRTSCWWDDDFLVRSCTKRKTAQTNPQLLVNNSSS